MVQSSNSDAIDAERERIKSEVKQELVEDFLPVVARIVNRAIDTAFAAYFERLPAPTPLRRIAPVTPSQLRAVPLPVTQVHTLTPLRTELQEESPEDAAWKLDNPNACSH